MIDFMLSYYRFNIPLFSAEKETENYFTYKSIDIRGFKGLDHVFLNFSRNDLVLLLDSMNLGKQAS